MSLPLLANSFFDSNQASVQLLGFMACLSLAAYSATFGTCAAVLKGIEGKVGVPVLIAPAGWAPPTEAGVWKVRDWVSRGELFAGLLIIPCVNGFAEEKLRHAMLLGVLGRP